MASEGSPRAGRQRRRVQIDCSKGGRTRQSDTDKTDINKIFARCVRNGEPFFKRPDPADFRDLSSVGDFMVSQGRILAGRDAYNNLPSEIRSKFDIETVMNLVSTDEGTRLLVAELAKLNKPAEGVKTGEGTVTPPPPCECAT